MKEEILKRKMFSSPMAKSTTNVGIMAGFDDEEMDDMEEDEAAGELTRRSPQSPEILMNNLRGDIRSVDARYEELAQMVGEEAAMETPPEVLALMQGQMAQQQGIGALPQAPQMPQQPMPQQPMPPQMAPGMEQQTPLKMSKGGAVQYFSEGSDEEGVTPSRSSRGLDFAFGSFSSADVDAARSKLLNMANTQPMTVPTLESRVKSRLPEYERLLAPDSKQLETQMLLDVMKSFSSLGSNIDPQTGQPMTGSFASKLLRASSTLPASIGERLSERDKAQRAIKLAAIQAGEKDIEAARAAQIKQADIEREALSAVVRSGSPFKSLSSMKDIDVLTMLAPGYKDGTLSEDGRRMFEARVSNYTQPQYIPVTDPVTGNVSYKEQRKQLPAFVSNALNAGTGVIPQVAAPSGQGEPAAAALPSSDKAVPPSKDKTKEGPPTKTVWDMADDFTGPIPALGTSTLVRPFVAGTEAGKRQQQSRAYVEGAVRDLVKNLQSNPRYAEGERKAIESELDVTTRFWDSPTALRNRLTGIHNFLRQRLEVADESSYNENLPKETRQAYRTASNDIRKFLQILMPPPLTTIEEVQSLPKGTRFIWIDGSERTRN